MENKKKLQINCATCDVRNVTEEFLGTYESVDINCATVITSPAAQLLLGKHAVSINAAGNLSVEGDVKFSTINGPMTIGAGQGAPEEKLMVMVNGPLTLEPGCEEILKSYVGMTVNGPAICPVSMTGLLGAFKINGPVRTYPDGSILLKRNIVLDRFFHLRAKQDALYYVAGKVIALAPDINFAKLAEKNVRFTVQKLIVSESLAEAAVPLFDEKADIIVLPDGCAYVDDDAKLDEVLVKRYGGKLYIDGSLTITSESAPVLEQVSFLRINGDLLVSKAMKDRVMALDAEYDSLRVVGGVLINDRAEVELTAALLENAEDGVSVHDCASVTFAEDVTPELIREKLVSITDCADVLCANREQMSAIQPVAGDVAWFGVAGEEDEKEDNEPEDENMVRINAAFYTL